MNFFPIITIDNNYVGVILSLLIYRVPDKQLTITGTRL